MHVIVAPDSFKGSLTSFQVAQSIRKGVLAVIHEAKVEIVPLSDGGEGMTDAVLSSVGGRPFDIEVTGPMNQRVKATFGILPDGTTCVIDVASACGLPLVATEKRNPEIATSFGVGELILAAMEKGCQKLIIGLGGSATNDGGIGMAAALGVRFLDYAGRCVEPVITNLAQVREVDFARVDPRLSTIEIIGACDVSSPLCGPDGASAVFGPQKGATPEQVDRMDALLGHLAALITKSTGKDVAIIPGAGAAGGLGSGLVGFLGGKLVPGSALLLELSGLEKKLADGNVDLVITGEGEINWQTMLGKVPISVASLAKKFDLPVIAVVGAIGPGYEDIYRCGIDAVHCIIPRPMDLTEAMRSAADLLEEAVMRLMRVLRVRRALS